MVGWPQQFWACGTATYHCGKQVQRKPCVWNAKAEEEETTVLQPCSRACLGDQKSPTKLCLLHCLSLQQQQMGTNTLLNTWASERQSKLRHCLPFPILLQLKSLKRLSSCLTSQ